MKFQDTVASDRKLHRNIMWIVDLAQESGEEVVDVIIPNWNPNEAVRLPVSIIRDKWIPDFQPTIGTYLIANVNNGAVNSDDLYFTHFKIAPESEDF